MLSRVQLRIPYMCCCTCQNAMHVIYHQCQQFSHQYYLDFSLSINYTSVLSLLRRWHKFHLLCWQITCGHILLSQLINYSMDKRRRICSNGCGTLWFFPLLYNPRGSEGGGEGVPGHLNIQKNQISVFLANAQSRFYDGLLGPP